jgi:phage repressor protein C with HTH and peptisase S24 domain
METASQRLKAAREYSGLSQVQLAHAAGLSTGTVGNIEAGTRGVEKSAYKLAKVLGVSPTWLATGEGSMLAPPYEAQTILPDGTRATALIHPDDVVPIKRLLNAAAMGGGEVTLDEDVILGEILVSADFIRTQIRPTSSDRLCFICAYGDSMEPTFKSGDVLLVDTGYTEPKVDGVYVLKAHDRLFVKRLRQRMDGHFEVSSDNPTHKTVDVLNGDNEVQVRGRVVWAWNGRRL